MSGYMCDFHEDQHGARFIFMDAATGASISWCPDAFPPGILPILAAELGVEPVPFYEHVRKYVDREAKKAARADVEAQVREVAKEGGYSEGDIQSATESLVNGNGPMDEHSRESRLTDESPG